LKLFHQMLQTAAGINDVKIRADGSQFHFVLDRLTLCF